VRQALPQQGFACGSDELLELTLRTGTFAGVTALFMPY